MMLSRQLYQRAKSEGGVGFRLGYLYIGGCFWFAFCSLLVAAIGGTEQLPTRSGAVVTSAVLVVLGFGLAKRRTWGWWLNSTILILCVIALLVELLTGEIALQAQSRDQGVAILRSAAHLVLAALWLRYWWRRRSLYAVAAKPDGNVSRMSTPDDHG